LPLGIGENCLEGLQVAVNIADDGPFQFTARFGASAGKLDAPPISATSLLVR
jgi:hypothetical protein